MTTRDHYDVLGIGRDASLSQIKAAYRKLARTLHPDVNKSAGATKKFIEVKAAYDALYNDRSRVRRDPSGRADATVHDTEDEVCHEAETEVETETDAEVEPGPRIPQAVADWVKRQGLDVDECDQDGYTLFHWAVIKPGRIDVMEWLLSQGADIDAKASGGWTPAHFVACWGQTDIMKWLWDHGADVHARDNEGRTPRSIAKLHQYTELASLLSRWRNKPKSAAYIAARNAVKARATGKTTVPIPTSRDITVVDAILVALSVASILFAIFVVWKTPLR